jgi:glycosyltransferase involved in cell wall biosynthesis
MSAPKISVVMPVYNAEHYLQEALDSILTQTFDDLELIAVNDGSNDGSAEILEGCPDPRLIVVNQENAGVSKAINAGIDKARGEYIARMDADDRCRIDRFEIQARALDERPEVRIVSSWYEQIDSDGEVFRRLRMMTEPLVIRRHMLIGNCFLHAGMMIRAEVLREYDGFLPEATGAEDYDLWVRMGEEFNPVIIPEHLYQVRTHDARVTTLRAGLTEGAASTANRSAWKAVADQPGRWRSRFADGRNAAKSLKLKFASSPDRNMMLDYHYAALAAPTIAALVNLRFGPFVKMRQETLGFFSATPASPFRIFLAFMRRLLSTGSPAKAAESLRERMTNFEAKSFK